MRPDTGSRTPEAYFLVKVHKTDQPVRPIISSYNSYNYNTAKRLATLLKPAILKYPSYVKDSFDFARIIKENNKLPGLMCSLDVSALFTNVTLDEAIDTTIKKIKLLHPKLTIDDKNLRELFYYCTNRTNFIFNNEHYDQINGVSMGSPLAPILAHLYMNELEENIINFTGKKPCVFYRYVDDIFMIFHGTQREIELFVKFMNNIEPKIKFTLEIQKENKLPFLDVMIERNNMELITYVYRKPTDTGLYLRWTSNQPLPYYGECSLALAKKIRKIIQNPTVNVIFGFKAGNRISSLFSRTFRGTNDNKRIVYGYSCYDCKGYYIGQTARGAEVRKEEHTNAFNGKGYSKIAEHCLNNKHRNSWNTDILAIESNDLKRNIKESFLMDWYSKKKDKQVYSQKSFVLNAF
ncbi:unnamed protein product [Rotaria socialis]|uniref:Reverse transcriptase domain-containing protein n=2 Tax=Rotaria socialis TaxID=392032 RepID=A0A821X3R2_9BILA|nr:unnamed protein product [Rotaria socialis]CAF4938714.1 unnamed protein product [Rotaria socialis]